MKDKPVVNLEDVELLCILEAAATKPQVANTVDNVLRSAMVIIASTLYSFVVKHKLASYEHRANARY